MFALGDIIECYSAVAGYPKFHLCVLECGGATAGVFLYINSETGYKGDFTVQDGEISCLPKSPTGISVISCSQPVRMNLRQLTIFKAKKLGVLSVDVAKKLRPFVVEVKTLTKPERDWVLKALDSLITP